LRDTASATDWSIRGSVLIHRAQWSVICGTIHGCATVVNGRFRPRHIDVVLLDTRATRSDVILAADLVLLRHLHELFGAVRVLQATVRWQEYILLTEHW